MQRFSSPEESNERFEDYRDGVYSTGPTRPPTKESFQKHVAFEYYPSNSWYMHCTAEMKYRNIFGKNLKCRKEHFFLDIAYEELQKTCYNMYEACKNGVRKCHKTKKVIEGVYCELEEGIRMPACIYKTTYKKGYALITCRWQDDIGEIIPDFVNNILEISGKQKSVSHQEDIFLPQP